MRVFVALEVPGAVIESLVAFQNEVSGTGADLKLVERENLHFTVKFLGEIGDPQAADAKSRLEKLSIKGAEVQVKGSGAFPSVGNPRVVWAGVGPQDEQTVSSIAGEVIRSLEGIGEGDDRPFRAHITLARVRSHRNSRQLSDFLRRNSDRSFGTVRLETIKLKSSVLTQSGPIYSDIGVLRLL